MSDLRIVPINQRTAKGFVQMWHRSHARPPAGSVFCIGVANDRPGWDTPSRPRGSHGVDRIPRTLWEPGH